MNDEYTIKYSEDALNDLRGIYYYIAYELKELRTARSHSDLLRREIRSLGSMPSRYPYAEYGSSKELGLRKLPVKNYVVFYTVDTEKKEVGIVRVLYGGRDINNIL